MSLSSCSTALHRRSGLKTRVSAVRTLARMRVRESEGLKLMPEDISNTRSATDEPGKTSDYVKDKIKRSKKGRPLARARKEHWPTSLAKVIKKAMSISERLTERDQAASVRVLREAKAATHRVFDPATKQLIEVPDHKTRLAAVTLELAYTEGRPIERQMSLSGKFEDLLELQERVAQSQAFKQLMESSQKTVEG
jgi:hypothetical protein